MITLPRLSRVKAHSLPNSNAEPKRSVPRQADVDGRRDQGRNSAPQTVIRHEPQMMSSAPNASPARRRC